MAMFKFLLIFTASFLVFVVGLGGELDRYSCAERAEVRGYDYYYSRTAGCMMLGKKE